MELLVIYMVGVIKVDTLSKRLENVREEEDVQVVRYTACLYHTHILICLQV